MEHTLFSEIIFILGLSAVALFVCNRLNVPTIAGFLLAGVMAGPHGFALVSAVGEVETLAEIGVVLLLFTIGIEFSLETLNRLRRQVLLGGTVQVAGTVAAATLLLVAVNVPVASALLGGLLISLSSTAIVLKVTHKRAEIDTLHGRFTLGVLIFQDLAIVPMLLAVPLLAGTTALDPTGAAPFVIRAFVVLTLILVSAKWILPGLLHQIAGTRDPEVFQVSVVVLGFGIAYLTYRAGLSLAMGAFLAGLILSESQYAQRALGNLLPMRDLFMSFFFVSVGMLFDIRILLENPPLIVGGTALLVLFKSSLAILGGLIVGLPLRSAILAGVALGQVGEFSFILADAGVEHGLLDPAQFQVFLGVSALSMIATPFLIAAAPRLSDLIMHLPIPNRIRVGRLSSEEKPVMRDHLVIIGYGLVGQHVAEAAEASRIAYVVLEANPQTVRRERAAGRKIFHGDATQEAALAHARVSDARVAVVAIPDAPGTRRIVEGIRSLSPTIHIIARSRYFVEVEPLLALGANEVIPEEYETSIEVFTRVLHKYLVPKEEITHFVDRVRAGGYEMLRTPSRAGQKLADLDLVLSDMEVRVVRVQEGAGAAGRTLAELDLRRAYGIMVLAIRRGETKIQLPDGDDRFAPGDEVVLLGLPELLPFADNIFRAPPS